MLPSVYILKKELNCDETGGNTRKCLYVPESVKKVDQGGGGDQVCEILWSF